MNTGTNNLNNISDGISSAEIKTKAMEESLCYSNRTIAGNIGKTIDPPEDLHKWYSLLDEYWTEEIDQAVRDGYWQHEWRPELIYHCKSIEEMLRLSVKRGLFCGICAGALEMFSQGICASLADSVALIASIALGTSQYNTCLTAFCRHVLKEMENTGIWKAGQHERI